MYRNEKNLCELLELALRVPEIGSVNFNILYYILKTIIQKQGLERIKPVFNLDTPLIIFEGSLLVETKDSVKGKEPLKKAENYEDSLPEKAPQKKEKDKWQTILFSKRINVVEDEISDLHIMMSELSDKISNFEKVAELQEIEFKKEVAGLHHLLEFKVDDYTLAEKLKKLSEQVSTLTSMIEDETEEIEVNNVEDAVIKDETESELHEEEYKLDETKLDVTKQETVKKFKKSKEREKEILDNIEKLNDEVNSVKEQLKMISSLDISDEKAQKPYDKKEFDKVPEKKAVEEKDIISKSDGIKIDLELLTLHAEVSKLMGKFASVDKTLYGELKNLKEKNLNLEQRLNRQVEDLKGIKIGWTEMVHGIESVKENVQCIEQQMTIVTEFPGLQNRVGELEGYVYSGSDHEGKSKEHFVTKVEKETAKVHEKKDVVVFKTSVKRPEITEVQSIEDLINEDESARSGFYEGVKFKTVSRNIALIQDMQKKKRAPKYKVKGLFDAFEDKEDYLYEEPVYEVEEKPVDEDFGVLQEVSPQTEIEVKEFTEDKSSTFASPDVLEEHSNQLRGQVAVFVKKRLYTFEIELQHVEGNLVSMKKKIDFLEIFSKDLNEKLTFMDANFSQRAGDLAALKKMASNHQVSIVNVMHHLERKAEVYAVNQKVSRKELTVIEDRVLKLCMSTSSEITNLEEKIDDSLKKFSVELDKKLFTEEFELRIEFLLHKLKIMENKLKNMSVDTPVLNYEGIRPIEIKKYSICKDGTKLRQGRRRIASWNSPESIIPILTQHHADIEVSPRTAAKIQKELELGSYRASTRYVEGAYTKINVGRK